MISLKAIKKVYQNGKQQIHALKDVSLEISSGEIFGIIGRSGAGKSTLARCINLLERPNAGTVIIDNCPITTLGKEGLRRARQQIGMLTKESQLLDSRTVYENIALGLEFMGARKAEIEHSVKSLLASMGLNDKAKVYPQMLTTGQKQKVALARALVQKPKILICDNTAEDFDLKTSVSFFQLLRDLNAEQKLTIVYITQDLDILKSFCQRIAVMHKGEIVEEDNLFNIFIKPRNQVTKELIKTATKLEMPGALRRRLRPQAENLNPILRISFVGIASYEPIIAAAIQQFAVIFHIIQAHLETIHGQTLGLMIVEVSGVHNENIQKAIQFLEAKKLFVEVLGYVAPTH